MQDIIETYVEYSGRVVKDRLTDPLSMDWSKPDLERLASFVCDSISNDNYESIQPYYPLNDLRTLERLHEKKVVLPKEDALRAIYHLIDDYLKPEGEQTYRLGPSLTDVISAVVSLGLEKEVDLSYVDKAIERARKDGHSAVAGNWEHIKGEIMKAREEK